MFGLIILGGLPEGMVCSRSVGGIPSQHVLNEVDGILTRIWNEAMEWCLVKLGEFKIHLPR